MLSDRNICRIVGCKNKSKSKGLCTTHHSRLRRGKDLTKPVRKKHGLSRSSEFVTWDSMLSRCTNENNQRYSSYGGRGISVCERWKSSFESFYFDMGKKPSQEHQLDRIDNNGNYCQENCRWSTRYEQIRNTRRTIIVTLNGKTMCLKDFSKEIGIPYKTVHSRHRYGWTVEEIATFPVDRSNKKLRRIAEKVGER